MPRRSNSRSRARVAPLSPPSPSPRSRVRAVSRSTSISSSNTTNVSLFSNIQSWIMTKLKKIWSLRIYLLPLLPLLSIAIPYVNSWYSSREIIKINNILAQLEKPFISESGLFDRDRRGSSIYCNIAFERPTLFAQIHDFVHSKGKNWIYHGPSTSGKSFSISRALNNNSGIIHINLRDKHASSEIASALSYALHYHGGEEKETADLTIINYRMIEAIKRYHLKSRKAVTLLIEDIHTCVESHSTTLKESAKSFLGGLVAIKRDGLINLLFTVSEIRGVTLLQQQSGYKEDLDILEFPSIEDGEMEKQLQRLTFKINKPNEDHIDSVQRDFLMLSSVSDPIPDGYKHAFSSLGDIQLFVSYIGSHMNYINKALELIVERNFSVPQALESLSNSVAPIIIDVFDYHVDLPGVLPEPTFHLISYEILSKLLNLTSNSPSGNKWLDYRAIPLFSKLNIQQKLVTLSVDILIEKHIISRIHGFNIKFYTRIMASAFAQVSKNQGILEGIEQARNILVK
ncbi:MAG: hypothetical protein Sylvanvirus5_25 [Sylvanvirus sp.]|uniref:Uncharacterized protein n=1 Tax=Sylvanvirus sp. TaxID=2487774 RepID=A0A3G5AHI5_9VIRU|nr:MAG: hypothetical protein Sylvanvirus5_25 [Sylvanvirus sp.]